VLSILPLACLVSVVGLAERPLDRALALAPPSTLAFVAVPNPKVASDDLQQCLERMERGGAALFGRPIDALTARLGISASFDDRGPMLVAMVPMPEASPAPLVFLPSSDPANFLGANLARIADGGEFAYRTADGEPVFARALARHVVLSNEEAAVRDYAAGEGLAAAFRGQADPRAQAIADAADLVAWGSRGAFAAALRDAERFAPPTGVDLGVDEALMRERSRRLLEGLDAGLVAIDLDPLGVGVRTWARAVPESELAAMLEGGGPGTARLDRLPDGPFYLAVALDLAGAGGFANLERVLGLAPEAFALPDWLAGAAREIAGLQLGIYPSRLGVMAGGILNDATLHFRTARPDAVKAALKRAILASEGTVGGVRREPTWTDAKALRGGTVADVYEVKETVLPPDQAGDVRAGDVAMQRLVSQVIYGSRGLTGLVRESSGGLVMTFSQRSDVLDRALAVGTGAKSLAADPTLASYDEWLVPEADGMGFIGLGQFGKLIRQVAGMVPGGIDEAMLPEIPVTTEPVAFAFALDGGRFESATVLPASVLSLVWDQAMRQLPRALPAAGGAAR